MKNTIKKLCSILISILILILSSNSLDAKVLSVPAIRQEIPTRKKRIGIHRGNPVQCVEE